MNNTTLIGFVSGIALAGTTLYWRRRERTVRESLTVSHDWETETNSNPNSNTETNTNNPERKERRAAREAAERLDARVEDLPERIAALDGERRALRRELDAVRERWADSWWKYRSDEMKEGDDPPVLVVEFDRGELPDARAFAKRAMKENRITLVAAHGDGSFAVAVGDMLLDDFSAADIASEITDEVGGGAGGNTRLAAGGGTTGALGEGCRRVKKNLTRSDTTLQELR
jgi:alanyl-tRNA synthetase